MVGTAWYRKLAEARGVEVEAARGGRPMAHEQKSREVRQVALLDLVRHQPVADLPDFLVVEAMSSPRVAQTADSNEVLGIRLEGALLRQRPYIADKPRTKAEK